MTSSLDDIRRRRAQLVARAAAQRGEVAAVFQRLEKPLRLADMAISFAHFLKSHPLVPVAVSAGIAVAFAVSRQFSILRVFQRAFTVWRMFRSFGLFGLLAARLRS